MTNWNEAIFDRGQVREKKREALVMQAALEFRKRGYHATSMDDIATALGVSKATLYRYVKSKDEVLYECFMHANAISKAVMAKAFKLDAPAAEKLGYFLVEFLRQYIDSNIAGGAMVEIDALLPAQRREVTKGRDLITSQLKALIEMGIKDGSISEENPKLMIFAFMGAVNWVPSWFSPKGEFTSEEIATHIGKILLDGIRSRP